MKFNAKKCYLLSSRNNSSHFYNTDDHILQQVQNNPYLGISFSEDLRWRTHINNICKRANLGFLRRSLHHCRMNAYLALARSKLEYGCVAWDPHLKSGIDKLEKIQRSAARFITRDYRSRHEGCVTEMLQDLGLQSLEERRRQLQLTFLYKVVEGRVPAINVEHYLKSQRPKRTVRAKQYTDFVTKNIVDKSVCNNSKCFKPIQARTENFRHSTISITRL